VLGVAVNRKPYAVGATLRHTSSTLFAPLRQAAATALSLPASSSWLPANSTYGLPPAPPVR
jgi:hypothetical protein